MRMAAKNTEDQPVWDLCEDLMDSCKTINTTLVGMQSRLELGMPVEETMKILDSDVCNFRVGFKVLKMTVDECKEDK